MTTPAEPDTSSSARSSTARSGKPGKKDNVFTRKLGPLPAWAWMAIVAAALLLFVMWRGNKTTSTGAAGAKQAGGGTTGLAALVPPVVTRARHGHRRNGSDDDEDTGSGAAEGPEREWLEKKTGSEHPWTFLAKHDEQIRVGPHGSRIVHEDRDERDRKHRRDHDDATASATVTTRPVPGQPAAGVRGQLMSFTTAADGPTPSLAQVASDNNTAPDAIIEEATGRGSPHGAMWRRYVARHDWQAPLPHGTDMTILRQPQ